LFLTLAALTHAVRADGATRADLSRLVVVGDSLSAGFQNGSLLDRQQPHGYASLLAEQARVALSLPLIAAPGIPNVLTLVNRGPPPVIVREPGISTGRVDPTAQATNLAVPGASVQDALTTRPDAPIDSLTDLVLGLPGLFMGISRSQVEWAEALAPTTILVWLGNNDALGAALAADPSVLTPIANFQAAYAQMMDRLAATGATLVVANIPDVTVIPLLTSAEDAAALVGLPLSAIGPLLGIGPGDFLTPDAFGLIVQILGGITPGPLPGTVVLDAGEVAAIRASIAAFNAIIAAQAEAKGAALVDIHALTESIRTRGFVAGGQRLTTKFLGGFFSLDGIHPTNTGYAVIANEFIKALNTQFAAGIPPLSVRGVERDDPLVLPGVGHPPSALGHVSPDTVASLRAVMVHR
jgi:phospholipase/lecithinase/hemolysin